MSLTLDKPPISARDRCPNGADVAHPRLAYQANGYFHASGLLDASELARLASFGPRKVFLHRVPRVETRGPSLWNDFSLQLRNAWQLCDFIRGIVCSRAVAQRAAELCDVNAIQLYSDLLVTKEPGCPPAAWHHDAAYLPVDPNAVIVAWIPLSRHRDRPLGGKGHDDCGGLSIRPGSHRFPHNANLRPELPVNLRRFQRQLRNAGVDTVDLQCRLGDVVFYAGQTSHRVRGNRTSEPSTSLVITYVRANTPLLRPTNDCQAEELRTNLSAVTVGRPLHTPLHPLLWSK